MSNAKVKASAKSQTPAYTIKVSLQDLDSITDDQLKRLNQQGITSFDQLKTRVVSRKKRNQLAREAKIPAKTLNQWLNKTEFGTIHEMEPNYWEHLNALGIQTAGELANRNADTLYETMAVTYGKTHKELMSSVDKAKVGSWIADAKAVVKGKASQ